MRKVLVLITCDICGQVIRECTNSVENQDLCGTCKPKMYAVDSPEYTFTTLEKPLLNGHMQGLNCD